MLPVGRAIRLRSDASRMSPSRSREGSARKRTSVVFMDDLPALAMPTAGTYRRPNPGSRFSSPSTDPDSAPDPDEPMLATPDPHRLVPAKHIACRSVLLALLVALAPAWPAQAQTATDPFAIGKSQVEAEINGVVLNLWVYKPDNYVKDGFVLLFHGASRAAEAYRDNAAGFADTYGRLVVVPEFDAERFPNRLYQFGGVFREDGTFADAGERTFAYVPELVEHIRAREGDTQLPYVMLGYSAGAQFIERLAAFMDTDAERLIAMSPGSSMFPTRDMEYGLGFGGLPDAFSNDDRIRRYLALPLTVAVGTYDREMAQLPQGDAYDQGVHRYSRNLRWFNTAMDLAFRNDWDFNWRLVIAHGAGHAPPEMFNHPQIGNALFGHRRWP